MSGFTTNGLPAAVLPLTGNELFAGDTQLAQGIAPESEAVSSSQLATFANNQAGAVVVATADNGTTQTLTAAMISAPNARTVTHLSAGGSTPSLTLPLATALLAALPNAVAGTSFLLRIINTNSGTATVVTNTGWTTTGTLTLATNTTRDFVVTLTNVTTGSVAATLVSVGTGATS